MKGLIGKKLGMTQVYNDQDQVIPVTVLEAGPCVVLDVKTVEKNGYSAVQLGYGSRKVKNVNKAILGTSAKRNAIPIRHAGSANSGATRPRTGNRFGVESGCVRGK